MTHSFRCVQVFAVDRITLGGSLTHVAKLIFHKRCFEARYVLLFGHSSACHRRTLYCNTLYCIARRLDLPAGALMRYVSAVQDAYSTANPFTNSTHGTSSDSIEHFVVLIARGTASLRLFFVLFVQFPFSLLVSVFDTSFLPHSHCGPPPPDSGGQ